MSVKLMALVWDRYPEGGGELNLALKLADHAHDDGTHIFPGVKGLAEKTRQSDRAVQYQLRRMEKSGWLVLVADAGGGRGKAREYRISEAWIKGAEIAPAVDKSKGAEIAPKKRVQTEAEKGANGNTKGANGDDKGCKAFAPESPRTVNEPSVKEPGAEKPPTHTDDDGNPGAPTPKFDRMWDAWPGASGRKQQRAVCESHWIANGLELHGELIIAHVQAMKLTQHWRTGGDPTPIRYLEQKRWLDGAPDDAGLASSGEDWWLTPSGWASEADRIGVPLIKDEPPVKLFIRVAAASGKGPWIAPALDAAKRISPSWFQEVVSGFGDALIPPDYFTS